MAERASYMDAFSTNRMFIYANASLVGTAMSFEASIVMDTRVIYGIRGSSTPMGVAQGARRFHGSMDLAVLEGDGVMDLVDDKYTMYPPILEALHGYTMNGTERGSEVLDSDSLKEIAGGADGTGGGLSYTEGSTSTGVSNVTIGVGGSNPYAFERDPDALAALANEWAQGEANVIHAARPMYADQMSNIKLQFFINKQDGRMWTRSVSGITPTRHNIAVSMENLLSESVQFIFVGITQYVEIADEGNVDGQKTMNIKSQFDTPQVAVPGKDVDGTEI